MKYTKEQELIIFSDSKNILVNAKAGTGKTSTLIAFTKQRPLNTFLYIAYNHSIRKEAKKKFFGNTTVHTIHSLAYEEIGYLYEHKLTQNLKIIDIIKNIPDLKEKYSIDSSNQDIFIIANQIFNLLNHYFSSKTIDLKNYNSDILDFAIYYWNQMQNINNLNVKMTHDGYLKLFQISEPELNYEYILVDEAQDSNDVMLDIISKQNSNKIFVGDKDQEIYGFRNINNVFHHKEFESYDIFYLTESFRFGENISYLANFILNKYKIDNINLSAHKKDEITFFDNSEKITILTRTNAYLFDLAIEYLLKNKKIFIIGGENFVFQELEDCYNLYKGNLYKIKNIYIKQFGSFNRLKIIAEKTMDMELIFLCKIIEKYKNNILEYIEKLKVNLVRKEIMADITLSTIHKSKGLEFFNVKLGEDFYPLFSKSGQLKDINSIPYEEINLYYVAITRTIEKIELNNDIINLLSIK